MVEISALWSWTYLNTALIGLISYYSFNFGLIYGEFESLLPLVEDLHQKVLCFAARVAI